MPWWGWLLIAGAFVAGGAGGLWLLAAGITALIGSFFRTPD